MGRANPKAWSGDDGLDPELRTLDKALMSLRERNALMCRLVECRVFGGMSEGDAARVLGLSPKSARSMWAQAKVFLTKTTDSEPTH